MKDYRIVFLDIDGTILKPDHTIENSTRKAIQSLQEKGIEIFLATGRPLHEIKELAMDLKINSYIGYNGAYGIFHGEDLFHEPMRAESVEHFLQIADQQKHEVVLYTNNKNVLTSIDSPITTEFMQHFQLRLNEPFTDDVMANVLGMTLLNLKKTDLSLYDFDETIHLSQVNVDTFHHAYDVIRDNVNKGFGVKMVLDHLSIPKECSIAFGDGMNDKEMLMFVGEGFAMGNAHPDLFQYANHKTSSVEHSGIYNGLQKLGLLD